MTINNNATIKRLEAQDITFETSDHIQLAGKYYPCPNCSSAVLICPEIGMAQGSYSDFARWLNEQGFAVFTFDYRGVGDSLFGTPVKDNRAKAHRWGQLDMTAALSLLREKHPNMPLHVLAHGIAGTLVGLMSNHSLISGVVSLGGSIDYVRHSPGFTGFMTKTFFSYYMPFCISRFGYVPMRFLGWQEDIPAGVAREWANWCLNPGHIRNSFGLEVKNYFYSEFHSPILVLHTDNDPSSHQISLDDMYSLFRSARIDHIEISPQSHGIKQFDHRNFFQSRYAKLWPIITEWLNAPSRQTIKTKTLKSPGLDKIDLPPSHHNPVSPTACTGVRVTSHHSTFIGADKKSLARH